LIGKVLFVVPYLDIIATLPNGMSYVVAAAIILFVILSEFSQNKKE